jgi:hypothetical protein
MPRRFDPKFAILPPAQREIWQALRPSAPLGFVLYGGTAIALQLGHRQSIDFDFFSSRPLDKAKLAAAFPFLVGAAVLQDERNTLVVSADMPSGPVKVSFFGGLHFGRVNDPLPSDDGVLLSASLDDQLATKLKAILYRAELRDYRDIAALLAHGVSLPRALSGFRAMFSGEPHTALTAIGYFEDGDLAALTNTEKETLLIARDRVRDLPNVSLLAGVMPQPSG